MQKVRSAQGLIAITIYDDIPAKFLVRNGSLYVARTPAVAGETEACIFLPKAGVYALAVYHDANGNKKFDRSTFGLPAEGYGFSNNPPTLIGLPGFRQVRLNVHRNGLAAHISLKYP